MALYLRSYDNLFFTLVFIKTGVYSAQRFGDFAAKSKVNCVSAWVKRFASMYTELVKAFLGVDSSHGNLFIAIFVVFYNLYVGYAYIFLVKRYTLAWWPDFAAANSYRSAKCHRFYVWLYGQFIMSWLKLIKQPFYFFAHLVDFNMVDIGVTAWYYLCNVRPQWSDFSIHNCAKGFTWN